MQYDRSRAFRGNDLEPRLIPSLMEYFRIFDLPPKLDIDMADLQRRFHELSRQHHPDYHTTQSADAQERSLRMTALLNDAYRTLRDPTRRAEYLVRSSGLDVDGRKVPQSLLMEVFEINEELEAVRAARAGGQVDAGALAGLAEFRTMLESRRGDYDAELTEAARSWDALVESGASEDERRLALERLAEVIARSAYLRNLEREIEHEVSG